MYLFYYIVFIIVMVMSYNTVGDTTCIEVLFSMVPLYELLSLVISYVSLALMVLCLLIKTLVL